MRVGRSIRMDTRRTRRSPLSFLRAVAAGAGFGALLGLLYVWQIDYSLPAFLAGLVGGSVAGAIIGAFIQLTERPPEIAIAVVSTGAGAVGGAAWWFVVEPAMSLRIAAAVGAGIVLLLLIAVKLDLPI